VVADKPLPKRPRRRSRGGGIEFEIDGAVVWIERGADATTAAAVIGALKAERLLPWARRAASAPLS
jgi:hypothetical protein